MPVYTYTRIYSLSTPMVVPFAFAFGRADSEGSRTGLRAEITALNPMAQEIKLMTPQSCWPQVMLGRRASSPLLFSPCRPVPAGKMNEGTADPAASEVWIRAFPSHSAGMLCIFPGGILTPRAVALSQCVLLQAEGGTK